MKRPGVAVRRVLQAMEEREAKRCRRCHRTIRGVPTWDVKPGGKRSGPYHPRCAPSFRDRMEVK